MITSDDPRVKARSYDPEGAARSWLRTALPEVSRRVFFGVPAGEPTYPMVTIHRVGGRPQRGEAPLADVRLQFSIYGRTKNEASDVTVTLEAMLEEWQAGPMDDRTYCYGAEVQAVNWLPDEASGTPKYVLDAILTVRAV